MDNPFTYRAIFFSYVDFDRFRLQVGEVCLLAK